MQAVRLCADNGSLAGFFIEVTQKPVMICRDIGASVTHCVLMLRAPAARMIEAALRFCKDVAFRLIALIGQLRANDRVFEIGWGFVLREFIFEPVFRILIMFMQAVSDCRRRSADHKNSRKNQNQSCFVQLSCLLFCFHIILLFLLRQTDSDIILCGTACGIIANSLAHQIVDLIVRMRCFPQPEQRSKPVEQLQPVRPGRFCCVLHMKLQILIQILFRKLFHELVNLFVFHSRSSFRKNSSSFFRVRSRDIFTALLLMPYVLAISLTLHFIQ